MAWTVEPVFFEIKNKRSFDWAVPPTNMSFKNATLDLHQKDKEIDELKCVIQVRLHSLTFFSNSLSLMYVIVVSFS